MKIAVDSTLGLLSNNEDKLIYYILVPDTYDFVTNNKLETTNINDLELFLKYNRLEYGVFRDSLKNNLVPNWSTLSSDDKSKMI